MKASSGSGEWPSVNARFNMAGKVTPALRMSRVESLGWASRNFFVNRFGMAQPAVLSLHRSPKIYRCALLRLGHDIYESRADVRRFNPATDEFLRLTGCGRQSSLSATIAGTDALSKSCSKNRHRFLKSATVPGDEAGRPKRATTLQDDPADGKAVPPNPLCILTGYEPT